MTNVCQFPIWHMHKQQTQLHDSILQFSRDSKSLPSSTSEGTTGNGAQRPTFVYW